MSDIPDASEHRVLHGVNILWRQRVGRAWCWCPGWPRDRQLVTRASGLASLPGIS